MRLTATPAQITTVEDRVAGNLSLSQLILLAVPLFITTVIFFLLPPFSKVSVYKLILAICISSASSVMAIRVNGKLMLDYLKLRLAYEISPKIYVYKKQSTENTTEVLARVDPIRMHVNASQPIYALSEDERHKAVNLLDDYHYRVSFKPLKSGGLNVKVDQA